MTGRNKGRETEQIEEKPTDLSVIMLASFHFSNRMRKCTNFM